MIRYTLRCSHDHQFESWFANAEAFERLKAAGHISCAVCGDTNVKKSPMAPALAAARGNAPVPAEAPDLQKPASKEEEMLRKLRSHLEANSNYVGKDFAKEARAMHEGEAPERAIHGQASTQEAKALLEDGVPVAPLPFPVTGNRSN